MCLLLENLWSLEAKRRAKISRRKQVESSQNMSPKTTIQLSRKKKLSRMQQVKVQMLACFLTICQDRWPGRLNLLHLPTNLPLTSFSKTLKTRQKNYDHKSRLKTRIKICCQKEFWKDKTRQILCSLAKIDKLLRINRITLPKIIGQSLRNRISKIVLVKKVKNQESNKILDNQNKSTPILKKLIQK